MKRTPSQSKFTKAREGSESSRANTSTTSKMYSKPNLSTRTGSAAGSDKAEKTSQQQSLKPSTTATTEGQKQKKKMDVDSGEESLEEEKQVMFPDAKNNNGPSTSTVDDAEAFAQKINNEEIESRYSDGDDKLEEQKEIKQELDVLQSFGETGTTQNLNIANEGVE